MAAPIFNIMSRAADLESQNSQSPNLPSPLPVSRQLYGCHHPATSSASPVHSRSSLEDSQPYRPPMQRGVSYTQGYQNVASVWRSGREPYRPTPGTFTPGPWQEQRGRDRIWSPSACDDEKRPLSVPVLPIENAAGLIPTEPDGLLRHRKPRHSKNNKDTLAKLERSMRSMALDQEGKLISKNARARDLEAKAKACLKEEEDAFVVPMRHSRPLDPTAPSFQSSRALLAATWRLGIDHGCSHESPLSPTRMYSTGNTSNPRIDDENSLNFYFAEDSKIHQFDGPADNKSPRRRDVSPPSPTPIHSLPVRQHHKPSSSFSSTTTTTTAYSPYAPARSPSPINSTLSFNPAQPLPPPVPSNEYLDQTSATPFRLPNPRPLLVILDLNGTLIHRKVSSKRFTARANVKAFLSHLLSTHSVMVWSSAMPANVSAITTSLFSVPERARLAAVWSRDKLSLTRFEYRNKTQVYKRLEAVWGDEKIQSKHPQAHRGGRWDQTNTILIDDSREKARGQPFNLIKITEFTMERAALQRSQTPRGAGKPAAKVDKKGGKTANLDKKKRKKGRDASNAVSPVTDEATEAEDGSRSGSAVAAAANSQQDNELSRISEFLDEARYWNDVSAYIRHFEEEVAGASEVSDESDDFVELEPRGEMNASSDADGDRASWNRRERDDESDSEDEEDGVERGGGVRL